MEKKTKIKFSIIIVIAIILLAIATIPKTLQEDTFYMIKVGEYITDHGIEAIGNKVEPFAWQEGMSYTYPHWLADVIFYWIFNLLDVFGIYLFTVIMGIAIYLLIYYTNIKIGKNHIISAIIAIASIYLLQGYMTARAQIITYICIILTILWIEQLLETKKKRYAIGLLVLPIIIANCHTALFPIYFVCYLPYIAEYIVSFINKREITIRKIKRENKYLVRLEKKENSEEKRKKAQTKIQKLEGKLQTKQEKEEKIIIKRNENVKWLIVIFIISLFTGLLTPLKDMPYTYTIKTLMGSTMNYIMEHQSVELINSIGLLATFFIIQFLLFSNKIKVRLQDLFMLLGMSILALISYKQFPIFWIGIMCIINKLIAMLISDKTKERVLKIVTKYIVTIKGIFYTTLVIIVLFLLQYKTIAPKSYIDANEYPVLATQWLKENIKIEEMKLFNDFNYGSYLLFKEIPVFIDGRADLYDPIFSEKQENIFVDYMKTAGMQIWYEEVFQKYDITHVITKREVPLNIFLQRDINYKKLYDDGTFVIYERNG